MDERKYRVNSVCPNCGEENAGWFVSISEDEQAVVEAYYAEKQFKSTLDMILAEIHNPPLRVRRSLRCPVCGETFSAIVPVCLSNQVGFQAGDVVHMGMHQVFDD